MGKRKKLGLALDKEGVDKLVMQMLATLPANKRQYTVDQYVEWCIDSIKRGSDPWDIFSGLQSDDEWEVLSRLAKCFADDPSHGLAGYAMPRRLQQWLLAKATTGARKPRARAEDFNARNKLYWDILAALKHDYNLPITIRGIEKLDDVAGSDFYSCGCAILAKHTGLSHNYVKDIYDKASPFKKYFIKKGDPHIS